MTFDELHDQITTILAEGLTADAVADAICAAVGLEKPAPAPSEPLPDDDPAMTGVPRDETTDSIDSQTGALTPEAIAAREKLAADQAREVDDKAKADVADTALADAQKADDDAHAAVEADDADVAADQAAVDAAG